MAMKNKRLPLLTLLPGMFLGMFLVGCDGTQTSVEAGIGASDATEVPVASVKPQTKEIQWYDGAVEQAFADARDSDTPVFLYWGAVWCPPCQEIKSTVFKSKDFIDLTMFFLGSTIIALRSPGSVDGSPATARHPRPCAAAQ